MARRWRENAGKTKMPAMSTSIATRTLPRRTWFGLSPLIAACLAATWLVWGSTYLAIKYALISFPPFFQMGTRFIAAGALLLAWMCWRGTPLPTRAEWRNALICGTLMLGGGMGGTAVAETSVGSGLVVAFIAVLPLMIALVNLVYGVKPGRMEVAGIAVGLVGVLMLTQGDSFQASAHGLIAVTVACVSWSGLVPQKTWPTVAYSAVANESDAAVWLAVPEKPVSVHCGRGIGCVVSVTTALRFSVPKLSAETAWK